MDEWSGRYEHQERHYDSISDTAIVACLQFKRPNSYQVSSSVLQTAPSIRALLHINLDSINKESCAVSIRLLSPAACVQRERKNIPLVPLRVCV